MAPSSTYRPLRPPKNLSFWMLGQKEHLKHVDKMLDDAELDSLCVDNPAAEEHVRAIAEKFNSSNGGKALESKGFVFHLVSSTNEKDGLPVLRRVLALGVNPDVETAFRERPSHVVSQKGNLLYAEALSLCRPDVKAVTASNSTPDDCAVDAIHRWTALRDVGRVSACRQISGMWARLGRKGFPQVAELASKKHFWALKNLSRRGMVKLDEIQSAYQGKDVFQWCEHHREHALVRELHYSFGKLRQKSPSGSSSGRTSTEASEVSCASSVRSDDLVVIDSSSLDPASPEPTIGFEDMPLVRSPPAKTTDLVASIISRLETLENDSSKGELETLNQRLDALEAAQGLRFTELDSKTGGLEEQFKSLSIKSVPPSNSRDSSLAKRVSALETTARDLVSKLSTLDTERVALKLEVNTLEFLQAPFLQAPGSGNWCRRSQDEDGEN